MAISKVVYNNNTLIDITDTTATASDVVAGQVFYQADGTRSVGTLNITDYVTSTGKSGNWYYRKWNSGRVEAEGYVTFPTLTFSSASNVYRSVSNAFTIPSGIFTTAPQEGQAWLQGSNMDYIGCTVGGLTTTGGNCQVWKRNSGNGTNVSIHMRLVYEVA